MKTFPMFLKMTGRKVVVIGGTEEALRKVRLVQRTDAAITLVADELHPELAALRDVGRISVVAPPVSQDVFVGAALAFIASGEEKADIAHAALARAAGVPVNVVDRPDLCDAFTPSIVDRDPLVVAIGTEGAAPVLGRDIRSRIEAMLEPWLGGLAQLAGDLRPEVEAQIEKPARRGFWEWVFSAAPRAAFGRGDKETAVAHIKAALALGRAPETGQGTITLVGAGPGAGDLLTLRAQQRLQAADVIFHDRLIPASVLELARRDADRVKVGRHMGDESWSQDRINQAMVAEARQGKRVVRLKSGDPGVFGRACEEIAAAEAAGIPVEIVPGITAAMAAGAALGTSLTERGRGDRLLIASATCRDGQAEPDWAAMLTPGTTLALYMAMPRLTALRQNLLRAGISPEAAINVVSDVSTDTEKRLQTTLAALLEAVEAAEIGAQALVLIRHPEAG